MDETILPEDSQLLTIVDLLSPFYSKSHEECSFCIFQYLPKYRHLIQRFENMLQKELLHRGCGFNTCIQKVMEKIENDSEMCFIKKFTIHEISRHFDYIFGDPMCGYNKLKKFDFFSLFDENNINSKPYVDFIYHTYKYSRSTSLCPYALLGVYVYHIMENSIGGVSEFKKKHDFLWMYNCLFNHRIRLGKLK